MISHVDLTSLAELGVEETILSWPLTFDILDMNKGLYVNPLQSFITTVYLDVSFLASTKHVFFSSVACLQ